MLAGRARRRSVPDRDHAARERGRRSPASPTTAVPSPQATCSSASAGFQQRRPRVRRRARSHARRRRAGRRAPLGPAVRKSGRPRSRAAMAPLAAASTAIRPPSCRCVGVTGTNGKTTTAYLARALLEACGRERGLLGTVKSVIGGAERAVTAHHARGDRPAGGPARDARRRRPRVRDRGLLARARARPRRRDRTSRRRSSPT